MATTAPKAFARPYKDFLTPFLHRNFITASLISLVLCYVESAWMAGVNGLWSWIPFGPAGIRTLLLFICALAVFVLRVANMHVGSRNTPSEAASFSSYLLSGVSIRTYLWYIFSALFFCEVYVWSQPATANLSTVDEGNSWEKSRLNERPIALRTGFFVAALIQASLHLYRDIDNLNIGEAKKDLLLPKADGVENPNITPAARMVAQLLPILVHAVRRTAGGFVASLVLYLFFLRQAAWHWTYMIASNVFTLPRSYNRSMTGTFIGDLGGRYLIESFLLYLIWDISNLAFTVYVSQAPLKNGEPLTNGSKDPNGSLLAGLKAKKEVPRTFAFWELLLIANNHQQRRQAIFQDIERSGDSAWSQIVTVSLAELHAAVKRIQEFQSPPEKYQDTAQQPIQHLPKLSAPLKQDDKIFTASPPPKGPYAVATTDFGKFAKAHGQSPGSISPQARKLLDLGRDALLTKQQQQDFSASGLTSQAQKFALEILRTPVGVLFRQTFARRALAVVLGPSGSASVIVDAILALKKLAICSLVEDRYGRVAKDVPNIIRTYTSTTRTIAALLDGLPAHWTDVHFVEGDRARVAEIEDIQAALKNGLAELVESFAPYADNLGLTLGELRRAREAAAG